MKQTKPETPAGDRIAKVLARAGVASRREAERMIEAGRVGVNGARISSPALNVTKADKITVDGKEIGEAETARLWLYHKPKGLVTTAKDEKGRATVFAALPEDMPRVVSVGRLDINSEGLLLLTNDGGIKRKLELPSTGWLRKYRARVNGKPGENAFVPLTKGITLDGERFQPMEIKFDRQQGTNAWLTIGIREGKNREIRRALESVGHPVNRLIRISYGPFRLGTLKPGEVEEVKGKVMREQLGMTKS
ncbi:MAG: pseudouridine synthase [Pseudomonadota bacterium]